MTDTAKKKKKKKKKKRRESKIKQPHTKSNDWLANEQKIIKIKSSFCKNVKECRIITITIILKWLLHFSFVLADRCQAPMVTSGSPCKI